MRFCQVALAACVVLGLAGAAPAQQQPAVVQLPSFSYFSVATTVSVPVSARGYGRALAGGNKFAAAGRNEFGPPFLPGQVGIGREHRSQMANVVAQIHDLRQMDRDLRGDDVPDRLLRPEARAARIKERMTLADRLQWNQADQDRPIRSVADIRRQKEAKANAQQREAILLMERGRKAQSEGKAGVAAIYYRMAAKRANGELKSRIQSLLDGMTSNK